MPRSLWHHPWFLIPTLLFVALVLWLGLDLQYGDEIWRLNPYRLEPLNTFFRYVTHLGEEWAWIAAIVGSLFWRYRFALILSIAGLLLLPVSYLLKHNYEVERPVTYFEKLDALEVIAPVPGERLNSGYNSFPSGHTMSAFALFSLLALMTQRRAPWMGAVLAWTAILVGVSRVFLAQHFLSDVLGGIAFGLLVADLAWQIDRRFFRRVHWLDGRVRRGDG